MDQRAIIWFDEITRNDIGVAGGKGANLGEMTQAKIPVPPGFVVTSQAYFYVLEKNGMIERIREVLKPLNPQDSRQLQTLAAQVEKMMMSMPMPRDLTDQIEQAYLKMGGGLVAVRSSATAEDLPEASFAGQQSTFLNIKGAKEVVHAVQQCWASLFNPRAIFYRVENKFDHFQVGIAVPVQRMVQSDVSGVMFTVDPSTSDRSKIVIEAIMGLGEMIVSGDVTPDLYIVDKSDFRISEKQIKPQEWKLIRNLKANAKEPNIKIILTAEEKAAQKISDKEILELARIGAKLEKHYGWPQDIEWAKEGGTLYIVQTRPVTTIKEPKEGAVPAAKIDAPILLSGAPASPGFASGPVKIILDPTEIDKVLQGDILVAEMTTPDFVPAMKRAAAIVTDRGGRTAHAAIVSRELGIPCVVGTEKATHILKDGQMISVNGTTGHVYNGVIKVKAEAKAAVSKKKIKTKTKLLVNLAQPELVEKVAARDVDGVGLLRAEFMVAQIGEHPSYMISQGRGYEFVDKLAEGLTAFAKAFHPRQVVYRATDFKTNEYRALKGGEKYEEAEENPMIGYRGASRYITDTETFKLEIEAIKKVRETYKNLWVMIPFVRTINELQQTIKIMEAEGLKRSADFKLWMMVEVPSNVFLLDKFLALGVDGVSIGSNDLTQLILGIDRDSSKLATTFDERNEAVMIALERIVTGCKAAGVTCSICGQAPSVYPELTEKLVAWGITSVSVSPDMIDVTREIIAKVEQRLKVGAGT